MKSELLGALNWLERQVWKCLLLFVPDVLRRAGIKLNTPSQCQSPIINCPFYKNDLQVPRYQITVWLLGVLLLRGSWLSPSVFNRNFVVWSQGSRTASPMDFYISKQVTWHMVMPTWMEIPGHSVLPFTQASPTPQNRTCLRLPIAPALHYTAGAKLPDGQQQVWHRKTFVTQRWQSGCCATVPSSGR